MEKKYVIKNFEDGTYLQQDREGWGEDFTMCEFDSLELAVDMVALQPYGNFTIEIIYKKLKVMEKKQSSIGWLVEEINKQKAWADPSKLDPIIEQAKAMHKEEVVKAFDEGQECEYQVHINSAPKYDSETYYNETYTNEK